jgi:hypothetical protein
VIRSCAEQDQPLGAVVPGVIVIVLAAVLLVHLNVPAQVPPTIVVTVEHAPVPVTDETVPPATMGVENVHTAETVQAALLAQKVLVCVDATKAAANRSKTAVRIFRLMPP